MKILHTGDWHMNDRLGRVDRSEDILRSLERIATYLEDREVDVMVVAGDLFCDRSTKEDIRNAVREIKRIFDPFLMRGGTILAISGNHDNEVYFETLRDIADLGAPGRAGGNKTAAPGRFYFAPRPRTLRLPDGPNGAVQFVLMPYPTARYLRAGETYSSLAEKNLLIQQTYTRVLRELEGKLDQAHPTVLVSHVHVRGVSPHPLYRLSEQDDVIFDPANVPTHWAYVAYGHIHRPQPAIAGASHIRYCGSIERLDAGEVADEKSVVLVEVGPGGRRGEPDVLPLESTPIHQLVIQDPDADLPHKLAEIADPERTLVHYTLHWKRGVHNLDAIRRVIQSRCPRWYGHQILEYRDGPPPPPPPRLEHVAETVRGYLSQRLASDPRRETLLQLAEALLTEEGVR